jgi:hypothetical protein
MNAAVHGVDPEAVEEDTHCSVGFFCAWLLLCCIAAIICHFVLVLKLEGNRADTH